MAYEAELRAAAIGLAAAAARLRDADDALVALGREYNAREARELGSWGPGGAAIDACQAVSLAYAEMRRAEAEYHKFARAARDPASR